MKKLLASLMILLLSVQALFASADVHQFHQPVQGHLERSGVADALASTQPVIDLEQDIPSDHIKKCQHCCHCHGGGVVYVPGQFVSYFYTALTLVVTALSLSPTTGSPSPELRPPIV